MRKLFFVIALALISGISYAQNSRVDVCKIYGAIYVEKNASFADFKVFVEKSESFADLLVFKQTDKLFADKAGQWWFTTNRGFADFIVFIEPNRSFADFSIAYTEAESFAGCKK